MKYNWWIHTLSPYLFGAMTLSFGVRFNASLIANIIGATIIVFIGIILERKEKGE